MLQESFPLECVVCIYYLLESLILKKYPSSTSYSIYWVQAYRNNKSFWFLLQAAAPKKWKGHDGKTTEMDTPYTIRAKELRDIYNSINMKYLTQDERLDVLLTLKHTVKVQDCRNVPYLNTKYFISSIRFFCTKILYLSSILGRKNYHF